MTWLSIFYLMVFGIYLSFAAFTVRDKLDKKDLRAKIISDIVANNLKTNGWNNILCMGHFPDIFYHQVKDLGLTFTITNIDVEDDEEIDGVVPYHSNFIVVDCLNFEQYEKVITKLVSNPYWHPLAHVIIYYHTLEDVKMMAKLLYILWYYNAINTILVQYNDSEDILIVTYYYPFISEYYQLAHNYACRLTKKIGMPFDDFKTGFKCDEGCQKLPINSKIRSNFFGTCLGFERYLIPYNDTYLLQELNLFENKVKNYHKYPMRAFGTEVLPFLEIRNHSDGSYTLQKRDGLVWNTMAELMNFTIDLTPAEGRVKSPFDYDLNIQKIFQFSVRKFDIFLFPVYMFDLVLVNVDYAFPYRASGVCFLAARAEFETILFDEKLLLNNIEVVFQFLLCFLCSWFVFFIFSVEQKRRLTLDQAGKDFVNTVRTILSIGLYNPPKQESFRIYVFISLWSFFLINFSTQAAIISFFSAAKRGKEVNTFEDIVEKGYPIEGMASPDVIFPNHKEIYRKLNSRLSSIKDLFSCVNKMSNNTHRFCLLDCAVSKYLERNKMNDKGEQYLHVAEDRAHGHYLTAVLHYRSAMTELYNKYVQYIIEAGLINKWEQYRFTEIKDEAPVRAMGWQDVEGIYKCYFLFLALSFVIFVIEIFLNIYFKIKKYCSIKIGNFMQTRRIKKGVGKINN